MRQKPQQIGWLAAKLIMDRIGGSKSDSEMVTIKVDADLVARASTVAPKPVSQPLSASSQ